MPWSALVLAGVVVAREPARLVGIVVGVAVAAGVLLFAGRRSMERALASAWTAQQQAFASFMDTLEGRLEIVAAGRRVPFTLEMRARGAAWSKAAARVAAGALVSGKLPLLIIVAAAVALAAAGGRRGAGGDHRRHRLAREHDPRVLRRGPGSVHARAD